MIRIRRRLEALALALTMAALTACGNGAAPGAEDGASSGPDGGQVAMGRYIEEACALPEGIGYVKDFYQRRDGTLELLCNLDTDTALGPWYLFQSADGGRRWTRSAAAWLERIGEYTGVNGIGYARSGDLYVSYDQMDGAAVEAALAGDESALAESPPEAHLIKVSPDGAVEELGFPLANDQSGAGVQKLMITDGGDLITDNYFSFQHLSGADGSVKNTFDKPDWQGGAITFGDTLAVSKGEEILLFDLTTGEQRETLSTVPRETPGKEGGGGTNYAEYSYKGASLTRVMDYDPRENALYYADKAGICRRLLDGAIVERLVNGEMTSLNMPSLSVYKLIARPDDSFLVLLGDAEGGWELLRYAYSADTPTVPTSELRIFSLKENKTVRQAMGLYQRRNPDVHVVYDVALSGENAVTAPDALRTLSTELLAGKGPDLLVLDGMPVDAYIEKGVLLDMGALVEEKAASGEWMAHQAHSFRRPDGKTYAVPARFAFPLLLAAQEANADSLSGLTDWLVSQADQFTAEDRALGNLYYASLIDTFYPVCAPAWFREDGSIKPEAFSRFLTEIKKLSDMAGENLPGYKAQYETGEQMLQWDSLNWIYRKQAAIAGNLVSIEDIRYLDASIQRRPEGVVRPLPGQAEGTFAPRTVLGVNANSARREQALGFLEMALSEQVQVNDFHDGLPVNAAAFAEQMKNPLSEHDDGMYMSFSYGDGEVMELQVKWPTDAYMKEVTDLVKAADTPVMADAVVRQMLIDETAGFFDGSRTLEETVGSFTRKLNLYLSE